MSSNRSVPGEGDADDAREDADSRVAFLKQRMEALKKRREGKAGAGSQGGGRRNSNSATARNGTEIDGKMKAVNGL